MKQRRLLKFHGLRRPRIRQTWNKYNLYNLWRLRNPNYSYKTFFQQKWASKAQSRGYHGEHIKEGVWERMFSRRLLSVVDMDPAYLAKYDGSEQAAGRGSGRDGETIRNRSRKEDPHIGNKRPNMTPYMQMTFAPMERRLDIAIFRALFASSSRQARQFVIHGAVKVNGVKMIYPGYLLNPGDMFQVDVEKVLIATGCPRPSTKDVGSKSNKVKAAAAAEADETELTPPEDAEADAAEEAQDSETTDEASLKEQEIDRLKNIHAQVKALLSGSKEDLSAKRKQEARALFKTVKKTVSRLSRRDASVEQAQDAIDQLASLMSRLEVNVSESRKAKAANEAGAEAKEESWKLDKEEMNSLRQSELIRDAIENPVDRTKPYMTPWQPRPFLAPFAFIPAYLEVNQNICSAVYLRHPVARKGSAEVPTPFPPDTAQLAFNWYLRRR